MVLNEANREMIGDITQMGMRAAILLKGVLVKKVNRETLEWGLQEINASSLLNKYVETLRANPEYVHLFNLLALVSSLEGQLDFQIREYGIDSLKDDLEEINTSLRLVGTQFDLSQLQEVS
jgi:hypothetical protein